MRRTSLRPDLRSLDPSCRRAGRRPAAMRRIGAWGAAVAIAAALATAAPCRADLTFSVAPTPIIATPGSSGTFEVVLTDPDATSYNVAADAFELQLSGPSDVTFTNVTIPTSGPPPYLYAHSFDADYGFTLSTSTSNGGSFPSTEFTATDNADPSFTPAYTTLNTGDTYALGLVSYSVSGSAMAGDTITIGFVADGTSLTDNNFMTLSDATVNGQIIIAGQAAVPELPTSIMWLFVGATAPVIRWARRRRIRPGRPG